MKRPHFLTGAAVVALASTFLGLPAAHASYGVVEDAGFADCLNTNYLGGRAATTPITAGELQALTGGVNCANYNIVSLVGAEYLKGLDWLAVFNNQIADVTPLAGLTNLTRLLLSNNRIHNLTPLAGLISLKVVTLWRNNIIDLSPLDGITLVGDGYGEYEAANQGGGVFTATVGTYPLPIVPRASDPLASVVPKNYSPTGSTPTTDVSVDLAAMTITYSAPGTYEVDWMSEKSAAVGGMCAGPIGGSPGGACTGFQGFYMITVTAAPASSVTVTFDSQGGTPAMTTATTTAGGTVTLPAEPKKTGSVFGGWYTAVDGGGTAFTATTAVPASITVYAKWTTPATETVVLPPNTGVKTDGLARLADNSDTYSLVITLKDGGGAGMTGLAGALAPQLPLPAGVTAGTIVDNGGGTYTMPVKSSTPGIFQVGVTFGGAPIGEQFTVNFIGATIVQSTRQVGQSDTVTGLGFLPSETVKATAHSTPLPLNGGLQMTPTASGVVTPPAFVVPADFELGQHYVEFEGTISGKVRVPFWVVGAAAAHSAGTGGSVVNSPLAGLLGCALLLAMSAGLGVAVVRYRRAG